MSEPTPTRPFMPTEGLPDYASEFKKQGSDEQAIIKSAKYIATLRREHIREIYNNWGDAIENMTFEEASKVLNEFLSPTCSLLEFEYKNLTKAGRDEADEEAKKPKEKKKKDKKEQKETPEQKLERLGRLWQKHTIGRVLTDQNQNNVSITVPTGEKAKKPVKKELPKEIVDNDLKQEIRKITAEQSEFLFTFSNSINPNHVPNSSNTIEIFDIHSQMWWFVRNVDIQEIGASNKEIKRMRDNIDLFMEAFQRIYTVVRVLVYFDILERNSKKYDQVTADRLFNQIATLIDEGDCPSEETKDLIRLVNMFIKRMYPDENDDSLMRLGMAVLYNKMEMVKNREASFEFGHCVIGIATELAGDEYRIHQVHNYFLGVHDFAGYYD